MSEWREAACVELYDAGCCIVNKHDNYSVFSNIPSDRGIYVLHGPNIVDIAEMLGAHVRSGETGLLHQVEIYAMMTETKVSKVLVRILDRHTLEILITAIDENGEEYKASATYNGNYGITWIETEDVRD